MKSRSSKSNLGELVRSIFRRRGSAHDPWLCFSMGLFDYTDGWNRTFATVEYARYWA